MYPRTERNLYIGDRKISFAKLCVLQYQNIFIGSKSFFISAIVTNIYLLPVRKFCYHRRTDFSSCEASSVRKPKSSDISIFFLLHCLMKVVKKINTAALFVHSRVILKKKNSESGK